MLEGVEVVGLQTRFRRRRLRDDLGTGVASGFRHLATKVGTKFISRSIYSLPQMEATGACTIKLFTAVIYGFP